MSVIASPSQPPTLPTVSPSNCAFVPYRPPAVSKGVVRSTSVPHRSPPQHLRGSSSPVCSFLSSRVSEQAQRASSPPVKADTRIHQEADVTPVQKVIQLLEGVLEKSKGEKHDEQASTLLISQPHSLAAPIGDPLRPRSPAPQASPRMLQGLETQNLKNLNGDTPCAGLQAQGLENWLSEKIMIAMNRIRTESLSLCTAVEHRLAADIAKLRDELDKVKREIHADYPSTHNGRLLYDVLGGDRGSIYEDSTSAQVDRLIGHLTLTVTSNVLERFQNEPATSVLNSRTEEALKYLERIKNETTTSVLTSQSEQLLQAEQLQQAMKDMERLKIDANEAAKSMLHSQTEQVLQAIKDVFQMLDKKFSAASEKLTKPASVNQDDVEQIHMSMKEMASFSLDLVKEVTRDRQQRDRDFREACERLARLESSSWHSPPNQGGLQEEAAGSFAETFYKMARPMAFEKPQTGSFESATI